MGRIFHVVLAVGLSAVYRAHLAGVASFALNHLLFPVLLLVVFGILFGMIGADYGLPALFWHDRLRTRLGAATAVTLLLALTGVLAFYTARAEAEAAALETETHRALRDPDLRGSGDERDAGSLARFLLVMSPPFQGLLVAPALVPGAFPRVPRSAPAVLISRDKAGPTVGRTTSVASNPSAYGLGLVTWLAGTALGVVIVFLLLRIAAAVRDLPLLEVVDPGGGHRSLYLLILILALFYAVVSAMPVYDRVVSPAFAICLLLGLLATAYAVAAYIYPWSFPGAKTLVVMGAVLWFALVNNDPYKLRFPGMSAYYPKGKQGLVSLRDRVAEVVGDLEQPGGDGRGPAGLRLIRDEDALNNWRAAVGGGKPKLVVVSVSGGAARSGLWVATILDRLEQQIAGFGRHVRLITGASGGMLGTGYYLLHRRETVGTAETVDPAAPYRPSPWLLSIPCDSLDPVARFLGLRDPFLAFLPRVVDDDRGIRLERAWKALGVPFRDLSGDEEAGKIPSMILSPMMIEDGRRLLISNLDLGPLTGSSGSMLEAGGEPGAERPYSLSALEFYRLFPESTGFHLGTGVRMNASFPYVSPAVSLPTDPPRRVFDAGVYDNFGVQVATTWLHKNLDWLLENTSGVVLVQIRDALSVDARLGVAPSPSRFLDRLLRGFRFFTSAPEAAESARTASTMFRNDEDVAALSERFVVAGGDRSFFTTVVFENSAEVSYRPLDPSAWPGDIPVSPETGAGVALNWYLTRAERDSLIASIPSPAPDSPWVDPKRRLERLTELREAVTRSSGKPRAEALMQLGQALNYERLVKLGAWWNQSCQEDKKS